MGKVKARILDDRLAEVMGWSLQHGKHTENKDGNACVITREIARNMDADSVLLQRAETDVWATPSWLYNALDREFGFSLDPCSDGSNAKCERFFTPTENGLLRDWGREVVFMNPPYSEIDKWMRKAYGSALEGATVVCLIPARTDTSWWHECAMKGEIRFIRGRLKFGDAENSAPFPSAVIVFRPREFKLASYG